MKMCTWTVYLYVWYACLPCFANMRTWMQVYSSRTSIADSYVSVCMPWMYLYLSWCDQRCFWMRLRKQLRPMTAFSPTTGQRRLYLSRIAPQKRRKKPRLVPTLCMNVYTCVCMRIPCMYVAFKARSRSGGSRFPSSKRRPKGIYFLHWSARRAAAGQPDPAQSVGLITQQGDIFIYCCMYVCML